MNTLNLRLWSACRRYGRICERCSGALALSLLQALAMLGCLSYRGEGGARYGILTIIAILAFIGFVGSILSIYTVIHSSTRSHKIERFIISCLFYPVVIGVLLTAIATYKSIGG